MADLRYLNIFAHDIVKMANFYADLFKREEIRESRTPSRMAQARLGRRGRRSPLFARIARHGSRRGALAKSDAHTLPA